MAYSLHYTGHFKLVACHRDVARSHVPDGEDLLIWTVAANV